MPGRTNSHRLWPVSFRPHRDEILYSWVARIAAVYGVSIEDLLPEKSPLNTVVTLVQEADPCTLKNLAASTGLSVKALAKRTLAGANSTWLTDWWIGYFGSDLSPTMSQTPRVQFCPQCLIGDAQTQFLRLRWQCAAMTICREHSMPLQEECMNCRQVSWPICERIAFQRYRFVCRHCGSPHKNGDDALDQPNDKIRLMARFENQLLRALANRTVDWRWIRQATPEEFVSLVTDLLSVLTRRGNQAKPIYKLQSSAFPLSSRVLPDAVSQHWRFGSSSVRRCLFAAVLGIFGSRRVHTVLQGRSSYSSGWHDLLVCLTNEEVGHLERQSWYWPPAAYTALHRAAQLRKTKAVSFSVYRFKQNRTSFSHSLLNSEK